MRKNRLSRTSHKRLEQSSAYYVDGRLGAYAYDHIYGPAANAAQGFFLKWAGRFGGPVLELGAGTGLISWAIAEAGLEVVAVDLSSNMLDLAERKRAYFTQETADRIRFVRADMVDFTTDQRFQTVMLPGRSFQHLLTHEDQRSTLVNIHHHLAPGGGLILTLFDPDHRYCVPDAAPPIEQQEFEDPASGHRIRRTFLERDTDPLRQTFSETIRLELLDSNGVVLDCEETCWSLRWTYQQEMRSLLEICGFTVEVLFSDFEEAEPAYGKEQIWIAKRG